jgi:type II secretory pathway pseudopilin PulG
VDLTLVILGAVLGAVAVLLVAAVVALFLIRRKTEQDEVLDAVVGMARREIEEYLKSTRPSSSSPR